MKRLMKGLAGLFVATAVWTGFADSLDPQPAYSSPDAACAAALREGKMLYVMMGFDSCYYLSQQRAYVTGLGSDFTDDFVYCYIRDTGTTYGFDDEGYAGSPTWAVFDPRIFKTADHWAESNGRLVYVGGWAGDDGTAWYLNLARTRWSERNAEPTALVLKSPAVLRNSVKVTAELEFPDGTRTDVTRAVSMALISGSAATLSEDGTLTPVPGASGSVTVAVQGEFWGRKYVMSQRTVVEKPQYGIQFHRNDANDERTESYVFDYGVSMPLPTLNALGWARRGYVFKGWATSRANADAGKVWKANGAAVATAAKPDAVIDVYAVWALKPGSYAIQFVRNDGAGTWRTVGFNYGEKTRMPSLANGLGWARRGYAFKGWALTTADANAGKVWKGDWAYVSTPVAAGKVLTAYAVWELKPGFYQIRFNKNDGSGKWRALGFECGVPTKLPSIAALGWKREGHSFDFWASSKANADAGYRWRYDGETVSAAAAEGKTLSVYAVWDYDWPWEGGPSTWD